MRSAGQTFVVYHAAAYRDDTDRRPGHGIAWEPFPGTTPYTKNSELMNAETSAWGRAIMAVGLPSKKIASLQEVRNRQSEQPTVAMRPAAPTIPIDRATLILNSAIQAGLTLPLDLDAAPGTPPDFKPVLKAKLATLGVERIGELDVDKAEDIEAWLLKEIADANAS